MKMTKYAMLLVAAGALTACGGGDKQQAEGSAANVPMVVNDKGEISPAAEGQQANALPFSGSDIVEQVVLDYGNRTVRTTPDASISHPELVKDKNKLFIVMSKKDYYLYVYEPQGNDTVMVARYDCAFSLKKGQKEGEGDMKTPHCTMQNPFEISQIVDASTWSHDFGDGRGSILSYGSNFLRLITPGHKGIGIHGSTNNAESVPGRASEGCIRLKDADITDLANNYAHLGMKVVIKAEEIDDYPFEIAAHKRQNIARKRHFDPKSTLSNDQIAAAQPQAGRTAGAAAKSDGKPTPQASKAPASDGGGKGMSMQEFKKKANNR